MVGLGYTLSFKKNYPKLVQGKDITVYTFKFTLEHFPMSLPKHLLTFEGLYLCLILIGTLTL